MNKKKSIYVNEDLLRKARIAAARKGQKDYQVVEAALRSYLGIGLLEQVWARSDLDEEQALNLAYEAHHEARRERAIGSS